MSIPFLSSDMPNFQRIISENSRKAWASVKATKWFPPVFSATIFAIYAWTREKLIH